MLKAAGIKADRFILSGQPEAASSRPVDKANFDVLVMGPKATVGSSDHRINHHRHDPIM